MTGFERSVRWSEEHGFWANHLKRKRKVLINKRTSPLKIAEGEVVIHFRVQTTTHFLVSLIPGVLSYCWPVFLVANKEKTLEPRLLALHFPVVLWYKWSRQAHRLSLTNLLPAKTMKVKWLGFCGSKNSHPTEINDEAARRLKRAIFPSSTFLGGMGVVGSIIVWGLFCPRLQSSAEYKGIANSHPPKIKDEAAKRQKRTIFPCGEVVLNFPSNLSKIVAYGRSARDTLLQGVKST